MQARYIDAIEACPTWPCSTVRALLFLHRTCTSLRTGLTFTPLLHPTKFG